MKRDTRIRPSLFDKLVAGLELTGPAAEDKDSDIAAYTNRMGYAVSTVATIDRFNERALRETVRRDLQWLMNTIRLEESVDLEPYPEVRTSVLNYGVPELSGRSHSAKSAGAAAAEVRRVLQRYEPRFDHDSLSVAGTYDTSDGPILSFTVEGDLSAALRARYDTKIEVETGDASVSG